MDHEKLRQLWPGGEAGIEGARRCSPEKPALRHGGYQVGVAVCRPDCPLNRAEGCAWCDPGERCEIEQVRLEHFVPVLTRIVREDGVLPMESAQPLIRSVVIRMLQYERVLAYADLHSPEDPQAALEGRFEIQGGYRALDQFEKRWERGLDQLGLSTAARLRLDEARSGAGGCAPAVGVVIAQAQAAIRGRGGEVEAVDAEFEVETAERPGSGKRETGTGDGGNDNDNGAMEGGTDD